MVSLRSLCVQEKLSKRSFSISKRCAKKRRAGQANCSRDFQEVRSRGAAASRAVVARLSRRVAAALTSEWGALEVMIFNLSTSWKAGNPGKQRSLILSWLAESTQIFRSIFAVLRKCTPSSLNLNRMFEDFEAVSRQQPRQVFSCADPERFKFLDLVSSFLNCSEM